MGEIYERMDNMLGELRDIMRSNDHSEDYSTMENIIIDSFWRDYKDGSKHG
ncbi:hypothetical protein COLO4_35555 [Corchorus olitorius]|uniref:Uncharacterized protein n=1 Tax=Corchorus olitorius TaxID=93759 RepID=A0A1R3GFG4_9ROSI|nr:hypothetical protein COLO4_35555 [Corchorus olitorius]